MREPQLSVDNGLVSTDTRVTSTDSCTMSKDNGGARLDPVIPGRYAPFMMRVRLGHELNPNNRLSSRKPG